MSLFTNYSGGLDSRQLGRIHTASLEILRETGMAFGSPEALAVFKSHGLRTSGDTVYFTDRIIERSLETAPSELTLIARNADHNIDFTFDSQVFAPGSGAVFVVGPQGETRLPGADDFIKAAQLAQALPQMELCRPLFLPRDIPPGRVHAWMMANQIIYQDKPYYLMVADDIKLLSLAFGKSEEEMKESALIGRAYGLSSINIISPLYMTREACHNLIAYCRSGVAFSITSMPAAGLTAPCSLAATILMQNCENLGALVLSQLISPGHPVFYGAMGGHSDMKSLSSVYGGPDNRLVELTGCQLAKYYGLLSRGDSGANDSPSADFQAGVETMFQVLASALQPVNLLPGCGHLGSFMGASLEKMLLDAELIDYAKSLKRPLKLGQEDLALEAIKEVGPKGNFINHPLTFKRFKNEFHEPQVFARESYEKWQRRGSPRTVDLAGLKVEKCLEKYIQPDIDPGLKKALSAIN